MSISNMIYGMKKILFIVVIILLSYASYRHQSPQLRDVASEPKQRMPIRGMIVR